MFLRFDSDSHEVTGSVKSRKEMFGIQGIYSPVTRRLALTRTHQPNPRAIGILPKAVVFLRLSWNTETNMFVGQWYESQNSSINKGNAELRFDEEANEPLIEQSDFASINICSWSLFEINITFISSLKKEIFWKIVE